MTKQSKLFNGTGYGMTAKCYESHKPYTVGGLTFHGGSCITPAVKDADVYIGFDRNMTFRPYRPWHDETPKPDVYFHITDMSIPTNPDEFKRLCEWAIEQAKAGKKVHAGCIGGHGRTGMFLALVTHLIDPSLNAIDHVRAEYCSSAVETAQQEKFLMTNFGVKAPQSAGKHTTLGSWWKEDQLGAVGGKKKKTSSPSAYSPEVSLTPMPASYGLFETVFK